MTAVKPPGRYGALERSGDQVTGFSEKPRGDGAWINGGFFVFRSEIFRYINPGDELVREPFQRLIERGALLAHKCTGFWQCMDTYRDWQSLESQWQNGKAPWRVWDAPADFGSSDEIPERWRSVAHLLGAA